MLYFSQTITENEVYHLFLQKRVMTFTELLQNFLPKTENLQINEIQDGIIQKLETILKHLNVEEEIIDGNKYMKLKTI